MSLGVARPISSVMPMNGVTTTAVDPRVQGEDPARIRATIARAPLFAALPITAIEDLTGRARYLGGDVEVHRRDGKAGSGLLQRDGRARLR